MAWLYSQPSSPSPWKPTNSLQAAENYLRQKLARPTYGHSQHLRQVYLRPVAPQYYQQSVAPQYYQQSVAPQYYQPPVQQFYDQAVPQYYEQSMQQYYEQPAPQYAPLGVGTGNIPKLNWKSLF
jgi:5-methylcytosine-specific restriction endonuclease McrBC GTP-binding regulatory subunit McrB